MHEAIDFLVDRSSFPVLLSSLCKNLTHLVRGESFILFLYDELVDTFAAAAAVGPVFSSLYGSALPARQAALLVQVMESGEPRLVQELGQALGSRLTAHSELPPGPILLLPLSDDVSIGVLVVVGIESAVSASMIDLYGCATHSVHSATAHWRLESMGMSSDNLSNSDRERVPYRLTLRSLGAFFDKEHADFVNVVEGSEGFDVRFTVRGDGPQTYAVHFTFQQLWERNERMVADRTTIVPRKLFSLRHAPVGMSERPHSGYHDFMRALGAELDDMPAYCIAMDEIQDGMVLGYLFLDARDNYLPIKRMVVLRDGEKDTLLHDAVARRNLGPPVREHGWGVRLFK